MPKARQSPEQEPEDGSKTPGEASAYIVVGSLPIKVTPTWSERGPNLRPRTRWQRLVQVETQVPLHHAALLGNLVFRATSLLLFQ